MSCGAKSVVPFVAKVAGEEASKVPTEPTTRPKAQLPFMILK